jgi:ADP-glucose pyrophosphorylase
LSPPCSFYDKEAPIYTMSRFLPPSKVLQDVVVRNAIIGDGSNIKARSRVSNSIVGLRSLIGEDCVIEDTLMLGSDYYETVEECAWVPGEWQGYVLLMRWHATSAAVGECNAPTGWFIVGIRQVALNRVHVSVGRSWVPGE